MWARLTLIRHRTPGGPEARAERPGRPHRPRGSRPQPQKELAPMTRIVLELQSLTRFTASMANLKQYLRVGEAAEFLGVSPSTVRNWERSGKLRAHKLPQNGYRLFLKADLEAVLRDVKDSGTASRNLKRAPRGKRA